MYQNVKYFDIFNCAVVFNQNIGNWNVSNVEYMGRMFECAISFNQIASIFSLWYVSNVDYDTDMFNFSKSSGLHNCRKNFIRVYANLLPLITSFIFYYSY